MGKGDLKTKRGKIHRGTTGKLRPRTRRTGTVPAAPPPKPERKKRK